MSDSGDTEQDRQRELDRERGFWEGSMSDDNLDTLSCAWCDLSQLGWAQSAGDGRQYPSCGEVGHGIQFAPDAQIVDDLRAALVSVRAELVAANTRLDAVKAVIDPDRAPTLHGSRVALVVEIQRALGVTAE